MKNVGKTIKDFAVVILISQIISAVIVSINLMINEDTYLGIGEMFNMIFEAAVSFSLMYGIGELIESNMNMNNEMIEIKKLLANEFKNKKIPNQELKDVKEEDSTSRNTSNYTKSNVSYSSVPSSSSIRLETPIEDYNIYSRSRLVEEKQEEKQEEKSKEVVLPINNYDSTTLDIGAIININKIYLDSLNNRIINCSINLNNLDIKNFKEIEWIRVTGLFIDEFGLSYDGDKEYKFASRFQNKIINDEGKINLLIFISKNVISSNKNIKEVYFNSIEFVFKNSEKKYVIDSTHINVSK